MFSPFVASHVLRFFYRPGRTDPTLCIQNHLPLLLIAELSAAAVLINFWEPPAKVNNAVWITVCLIVAVVINLLGAGMSFFALGNS